MLLRSSPQSFAGQENVFTAKSLKKNVSESFTTSEKRRDREFWVWMARNWNVDSDCDVPYLPRQLLLCLSGRTMLVMMMMLRMKMMMLMMTDIQYDSIFSSVRRVKGCPRGGFSTALERWRWFQVFAECWLVLPDILRRWTWLRNLIV